MNELAAADKGSDWRRLKALVRFRLLPDHETCLQPGPRYLDIAVFGTAGLTLATSSLTIDPTEA